MTGPIRATALATISVLLTAACGLSPSNGYAQSDEGHLSFRYPGNWSDLGLEPTTVEWVVGIDAAAQPEVDHALQLDAADPVLVASVSPLEQENRDLISLASLRRLAIPDVGDPIDSTDNSVTVLFHNTIVDTNGFEGHHLRFTADNVNGGGAVTTEQFAVLDPERLRVHHIRVTCSNDCFDRYQSEIDDVFASVRLRP